MSAESAVTYLLVKAGEAPKLGPRSSGTIRYHKFDSATLRLARLGSYSELFG